MGTPADVAGLVSYLASKESHFITGTLHLIDWFDSFRLNRGVVDIRAERKLFVSVSQTTLSDFHLCISCVLRVVICRDEDTKLSKLTPPSAPIYTTVAPVRIIICSIDESRSYIRIICSSFSHERGYLDPSRDKFGISWVIHSPPWCQHHG